jgi:hypothetical protein
MAGIDADGIIVRQIQMIGYKDMASIESMNSVKSEDLVKLILFLFEKIPETQGRLGQPPTAKSALFRFATELVNLLTTLGYSEDIRYDNILYPKGDVTRSILRFILDKIPRAGAGGPTSTSSVSQLSLAISAARLGFSDALKNKTDRPPLSQPLPLTNRSLSSDIIKRIADISSQVKQPFYECPLHPNGVSLSFQCGANIIASVLARNDREMNFDFSEIGTKTGKKLKQQAQRAFNVTGLTTSESFTAGQPVTVPSAKIRSRLENIARFEFATSDTKLGAQAVAVSSTPSQKPDSEVQEREIKVEEPKLTMEQVASIRSSQKEEFDATVQRLQTYEQRLGDMEAEIEANRQEASRLREAMISLTDENERYARENESLGRIAEISAADPSLVRQLKQDLISSTTSILEIAHEWEPKRAALISEYRALSTALRNRNVDRSRMMKKLEKLKKQIADAGEKSAASEISINDLKGALETRGDQLHRHHYVEMIFDMIRKVEKQEAEIEKTRVDIRLQHQRMGQTIETVKRTWGLLDETIYTDAKKKGEGWIRKCYKMVVDLLTLFEGISDDIENAGKLQTQCMELDAKIAHAEEQSDPEALKRITDDLEALKEEIAAHSHGDD